MITNVEFEWDPAKNALNLRKHAISFEEAIEIFDGPVFTAEDKRRDYGEDRFVSIGAVGDIVILVVIHTDRKRKTRIISARKANKTERRLYHEYLKAKS